MSPFNSQNAAPQKHPSELLTVTYVATRLRVDETTVRRWIKQGALAAIELPHRGRRRIYRIRQSTLDAILEPATASTEPGKELPNAL